MRWIALITLLLASIVSAQTLSLSQSGSGVTATTTVTSTYNGTEQFRLVWEAADNWGLSQWYDSLNDPSFTTNLILAYSVNGPSVPCNKESAIDNFVIYADSDDKLAMYQTNTGCPSAANFPAATMTIVSNTPSEIIIKVAANPMSASTAPDTNLTGTVIYYIFPNGKIYLNNSLHATNAVNLSTDQFYIPTIELNNPVGTGSVEPDTVGWIRADSSATGCAGPGGACNPWNGGDYPYTNLPYIFSYWSPNTASPYTNFTKASIMLNRSPSNPVTQNLIIHGWGCGTGCGVTRWGYASVGPNLSAGQTVTSNYMIQLGTQGSAILPDLRGTGAGGSGVCTTCNTISAAYLANPLIAQQTPSVIQGTTLAFSETNGDPGTWSCSATNATGGATTCAGSINSSTGVYTAPASVTAHQSLGGYQLLPNNHIYNTRIDSLPVNTNSAAWIGVTAVPLSLFQLSFPINYTNAATPTQQMNFFYPNQPGSPANGLYQIPAFPGTYPTNARIENGWLGATTNQNQDHHLLTFDTSSGNMQDMYQFYNAGLNSSCATCNSQEGVKYNASTYPLAGAGGSSDAAGMFVTPAMLRLQEVEQALASGGTLNHALRMTLALGFCASSNLWPATRFATDGGTVPFGARFRLKSTFTKSTYSSICQTTQCQNAVQLIITQLKQYGLIMADGGTSWASQVEYTKWPTQLADALFELSYSNITPSNFEAVDESSLMVSASSGLTTNNREIITFTRTSDSATASTDVVLTGVVVSFPFDLQQIQVGAPAQTFAALANTGSVTYSMSPTGTGTLNSSTGLYTPPASLASPTTLTVTATSTVNSSVTASFTLNVFPAGTIRLVPGSAPASSNFVMIPTNYTDTSSNVWYPIGDDGGYANSCNTISGTTDNKLYCYEYAGYQGLGDMRFDIIVPNQNYQVTYKGANTSGSSGTQVQTLELNGTNVASNLDVFVAAGGANKAFDDTFTTTVSNNRLSFVLREVNTNGTHIGSLLITPVNSFPPSGCAIVGTGPNWSCAAGALSSDVNSALSGMTDGATLTFQAGNYTFSAAMPFSLTKGATLICATAPPAIGGATTGGCNITATNSDYTFGIATWTAPTNSTEKMYFTKLYRVSGFNWSPFPNGTGAPINFGNSPSAVGEAVFTQLRFDHNTFNITARNATPTTVKDTFRLADTGHRTYFYGVIDHNNLICGGSCRLLFGSTALVDPFPPPNPLGTGNNIFLEDNTVTSAALDNSGIALLDWDYGTQPIVVRHNTTTDNYWSTHYTIMNMEYYNNALTMDANATGPPSQVDCYRASAVQGVSLAMTFNDTFTCNTNPNSVVVSRYSIRDAYKSDPRTWPKTLKCTGFINHYPFSDGNRSPSQTNQGYPCYWQGARDMATGALFPFYAWNITAGTSTQAYHAFSPEDTGFGQNPDFFSFHMQNNRDYYQTIAPGTAQTAVASCTDTAGVWFGPIGFRPTNCPAYTGETGGGFGYVAQTTTGTIGSSGSGVASDAVLYQCGVGCSGASGWKQIYTPYHYPHPLVDGTTVAEFPTFDASHAPGNYSGTQTVTVSTAAPSPTLYCTTDGTAPTHSSPSYSGATYPAVFTVSATETISCIASSPSFRTLDSLTLSGPFYISATSNNAWPAQPGGFPAGTLEVQINNPGDLVSICATDDGTTPTSSGSNNGLCGHTHYTNPVLIGSINQFVEFNLTTTGTNTVKFMTTGINLTDSPVTTVQYTLGGTNSLWWEDVGGPNFAINGTPVALNFGNQAVGTTSGSLPITLNNVTNFTNCTGCTLPTTTTHITSAALSGTGFAFANPTTGATTGICSTSIANPQVFNILASGTASANNPLQWCSLMVTFTPPTAGTFNGTLTITDDAAGSPHVINLTGSSSGSVSTLTPNPLSFGNQNIHTTSGAQTATLTNTGTVAVHVSNVTVVGSFTNVGTGNCPAVPFTLNVGANCTFNITFSPSTTGTGGSNTGTLTVTDDASNSPQSISLTGTGTVPVISWSSPQGGTVYNFGNVNVGVPTSSPSGSVCTTTPANCIELTNTGTGPLNVALTITGTNAAQFSPLTATTCASTLAAGASCTATATFTPNATGPFTAFITETDSVQSLTANVTLNGTGGTPPTNIVAPWPVMVISQEGSSQDEISRHVCRDLFTGFTFICSDADAPKRIHMDSIPH